MKPVASLNSSFSRLPYLRLAALSFAAIVLALPRLCAGITFGQTDTFQDGSTDGWGDPAGNSSNISTGGPGGAGDRYMQVVSGSFGGSSHMVTFNDSQWLGNYTAAGVTEVTMNLKNFGPSAIPIRICIRQSSGGSATPGYCSTTAFNLAADGQWHNAVFLLDAADLTPVNNPQPLATDLQNVGDFRILSAASPSGIGDSINAEIGVDNIHATAVPEPGAAALIGLSLAFGAFQGRKSRP
ncbi:MAG: hypothetical protein C5B50_04820 [Verrucomicrobia bacterium]|nr:MAG: hypothetical protein C5B50_04820 [Verrucomicrobiota bacterium]